MSILSWGTERSMLSMCTGDILDTIRTYVGWHSITISYPSTYTNTYTHTRHLTTPTLHTHTQSHHNHTHTHTITQTNSHTHTHMTSLTPSAMSVCTPVSDHIWSKPWPDRAGAPCCESCRTCEDSFRTVNKNEHVYKKLHIPCRANTEKLMIHTQYAHDMHRK